MEAGLGLRQGRSQILRPGRPDGDRPSHLGTLLNTVSLPLFALTIPVTVVWRSFRSSARTGGVKGGPAGRPYTVDFR